MRTFALLALAALSGCATGPSRAEILAGLVGRPESDAIRVLGAPNQVLDANGHRFLAYQDQRIDYIPAAPISPFFYGYVYGAPAAIPIPRACTTTLEIAAGRVANWTLRGDGC